MKIEKTTKSALNPGDLFMYGHTQNNFEVRLTDCYMITSKVSRGSCYDVPVYHVTLKEVER